MSTDSLKIVAEGDRTFRVTREGRVVVNMSELLSSEEVGRMASAAQGIVRLSCYSPPPLRRSSR